MPPERLTVRGRNGQTGADMNTQTAIEGQPQRDASKRLVPIEDASQWLGRSVWTLKRLYADGNLPETIIGNLWLVPEDVVASPGGQP